MENLEQAVGQAVSGDKAAQTALYNISNKQVFYTCLGIVKNEADAEDIMQEVYMTAFQKLATLTDPNSFQAWINRIAVTRCMNFVKKRRNISLDEELEGANREIADEELVLPEDYVSDKVKAQVLQGIINEKLSDVQRQTILMYYFHEMRVEDIAVEMECPVGTVKYRLSASRQIIKKEVLDYEKKSGDRLHTFIPFPFGAFMLSQASRLTPPALGILGGGAASSAAHSAAVQAADKTAKAAVKKGIGIKIAAGVTAAAVATGTAAYVLTKPDTEEEDDDEEESTVALGVVNVYGMLDSGYRETLETTGHHSVLKNDILYFHVGDKIFTYDAVGGNFGTIETENLQKNSDVQFFGDYIYVMTCNNVSGYFLVDKYDLSGGKVNEIKVQKKGASIDGDDQSMRILSDGSFFIVDQVDFDDYHYISSDFEEQSLPDFPEETNYLDFYGDDSGDNIFVLNDFLYIGETQNDGETPSLLYDTQTKKWSLYYDTFCAYICGDLALSYDRILNQYEICIPSFIYSDWEYTSHASAFMGSQGDDVRDYNGGETCYRVDGTKGAKTIYVDTDETEFTQIGEESYDYTPLAYQYFIKTTEDFGNYTYYLCDGENEPVEVPVGD